MEQPQRAAAVRGAQGSNNDPGRTVAGSRGQQARRLQRAAKIGEGTGLIQRAHQSHCQELKIDPHLTFH